MLVDVLSWRSWRIAVTTSKGHRVTTEGSDSERVLQKLDRASGELKVPSGVGSCPVVSRPPADLLSLFCPLLAIWFDLNLAYAPPSSDLPATYCKALHPYRIEGEWTDSQVNRSMDIHGRGP